MNQLSFELLDLEEENSKITEIAPLSPLQQDVLDLINAGETSALAICEELIKAGKIPKERFSTDKPKAYGKVSSILDYFVSINSLVFVEDKDKKDRIYGLK